MRRTIGFLIFALFINFSFAFGMTPAEEKKLFQDIAEIKATLKVFMEQTDKRFEQVDKRFEDMNKRFEVTSQKVRAKSKNGEK